VSIPKDIDPYTITPERAVELIEAKRIADANKTIKLFAEDPEIQILNGRFGPYIKAGKKNVKIPKDREPASLTYEECVALAADAPERRGRFGRRAPAETATKTAAKTATKAGDAPKKTTATKATAVKKTAPKKVAKKTAAKKTAAKKTAAKKAAPKKKK